MPFTIELNLGGNALDQLTQVEAKLRSIQALAARGINLNAVGAAASSSVPITGGVNGASSRVTSNVGQYRGYIPEWYSSTPYFDTNSKSVVQSATNNAASRVTTNKDKVQGGSSMFRNMAGFAAISTGSAALTGNYQAALQGIGATLGLAIAPNISKGIAKILSTPAGWAVAGMGAAAATPWLMRAGTAKIGGNIYERFSGMLNDERMTQAIQNVTLMRFANRAGGAASDLMLLNSEASRMQNEWGMPRGLAATSTRMFSELTGSSIGTASIITEAIAKMAGISGAPIEKLTTNTAQILSVLKPNMRDIREQNQSTGGLIVQFANRLMKQQGSTETNPLEWLRQRENMLSTMFAIADDVELTGAARARATIKGAETSAWERLAGRDSFWKMFAGASTSTFGVFASSMERQMSMWEENPTLFNELITQWSVFGTQMAEILPKLGLYFGALLDKVMDWLGMEMPNTVGIVQEQDVLNRAREKMLPLVVSAIREKPEFAGMSDAAIRRVAEGKLKANITEDQLIPFGQLDYGNVYAPLFSNLAGSHQIDAAVQYLGSRFKDNKAIVSRISELAGMSQGELRSLVDQERRQAPGLFSMGGKDAILASALLRTADTEGWSIRMAGSELSNEILGLPMFLGDMVFHDRKAIRSNIKSWETNAGTTTGWQFYSQPAEEAAGFAGFGVLKHEAILEDTIKGTIDGLNDFNKTIRNGGGTGSSPATSINGSVNRQVYINFNAPLSDQTITINSGASAQSVASAIRENRDEVGLRTFAVAMQQVGAIIQARGT